jgi:1-deoxy-D-xylulose-5-phosphate reductoisomerase
MGQTDMYLPILYALGYPERLANKFPPLDLTAAGRLDFARPDPERFPCLAYAYEAIRTGGTLPAAVNAANEVAVEAFLEGKIPFTGIARTVRAAMDRHEAISDPDIDTLRETDRAVREMAREYARVLA